ncbi:MAG: low molecular weight phosphatase family protein [Alphaproteobacteria bacterium]|nr:low molecular weight phosphatase family protein [Alphaproteobacteria bacterium]MCB9928101.1 low molecular weight phosphatase family protein [Alphaproteobacteria bacterium]
MAQRIQAVLFACEMNVARSVMAEAWLKHFHGQRIYVDSCGLHAGHPDPFVATVMLEVGIDVSRHASKTFDDLVDGYFDLIVALAPPAQVRAIAMARMAAIDVEFWPTMDATVEYGSRERRLDAYRAVRDYLRDRILQAFPVSK